MVKRLNMVDRSIYWKGFLAALFLFIISLGIGYYIENERTTRIRDTINDINLAIDSSLTTLIFIQSTKDTKNCAALKSAVYSLWAETNKLRDIIEEQRTNVLISPKSLNTYYYLTNLKLYLLTKDYKQTCQQNLSNILFFYTAYKDCAECKVQGQLLDELRYICKDKIAVFAFPVDAQEVSALNVIISYYNITKVPSLVVDDKLISKTLTKEQLLNMVNC
jgi:hypothetical protein